MSIAYSWRTRMEHVPCIAHSTGPPRSIHPPSHHTHYPSRFQAKHNREFHKKWFFYFWINLLCTFFLCRWTNRNRLVSRHCLLKQCFMVLNLCVWHRSHANALKLEWFAWYSRQFLFRWKTFSIWGYRIKKILRFPIPNISFCSLYKIYKAINSFHASGRTESLFMRSISRQVWVWPSLDLFAWLHKLILFGYELPSTRCRICLSLELSLA